MINVFTALPWIGLSLVIVVWIWKNRMKNPLRAMMFLGVASLILVTVGLMMAAIDSIVAIMMIPLMFICLSCFLSTADIILGRMK